MDLKKTFLWQEIKLCTFSQNFWCAHFCAPFGQNMCAFVRFFEKFWCAHFCAPFGQNMCAFEFRIIGHSENNKHKLKNNFYSGFLNLINISFGVESSKIQFNQRKMYYLCSTSWRLIWLLALKLDKESSFVSANDNININEILTEVWHECKRNHKLP